MPMTPQQRSDAARKAAATKRRNAAARGFAPPPPRPQPTWQGPLSCSRCGQPAAGGTGLCDACRRVTAPPPPPPPPTAPRATAFASAAKTVAEQRLAVTNALVDLFALVCAEKGKSQERIDAFELYKKAMRRALSPASSTQDQNEADVALRLATITLIKQTF
jgi:hypothetical protein